MTFVRFLSVFLFFTLSLAMRSAKKCGQQPILAADLYPTTGNKAYGRVELSPEWNVDRKRCMVRIRAVIKGLTGSKHGFHIHTYGDNGMRDGSYAGGHFAHPKGKTALHGLPGDSQTHWGDMGNLDAVEGVAKYDALNSVIKIPQVIGRGIVVHALQDMGRDSQPSGAAGARIAFGVIGYANPEVMAMRGS